MKREAKGIGFAAMKKGHEEKSMRPTECANMKYARSEMGNPEELSDSVNKLASYVKKNRVKR